MMMGKKNSNCQSLRLYVKTKESERKTDETHFPTVTVDKVRIFDSDDKHVGFLSRGKIFMPSGQCVSTSGLEFFPKNDRDDFLNTVMAAYTCESAQYPITGGSGIYTCARGTWTVLWDESDDQKIQSVLDICTGCE